MEQKAGKGNRKIGRNADKCKRYALEHRREKNKLRRVLRSSGKEAAVAYADKYALGGYLRALL